MKEFEMIVRRFGRLLSKYKNQIFLVFALFAFLPSPPIFSIKKFLPHDYLVLLVGGLTVIATGMVIRAMTSSMEYVSMEKDSGNVRPDRLITNGLYHHCRNPLYIANVLVLFGIGLLANSFHFILSVVPMLCFIYHAIVLTEENYLGAKFGLQYRQYTRNVNRWIPDLDGLVNTLLTQKVNWKRHLVKEYDTIYLISLSIYIMVMLHHPQLVKLGTADKIILSRIVVPTLTLIYLVIKYLDKSKRLI